MTSSPNRVSIAADGGLLLPLDLLRRHGLADGGQVVVEERGAEIVLRSVDDAVTRARAVSRMLLAGKAGANVAAFLADRRMDEAGD